MPPTLAALADDLAAGRTTAVRLVEEALARIADQAGEGGRAFVRVHAASARAAAAAMDGLRAAGLPPSPYAGIPISSKDLFDLAGEPTPAGSVVLAGAAPASADAPAIARLRAAGLIVVGRTNMTEFAFSGVGINPHHGTPASPWDRAGRRIPGGSSSGAAVSVGDGMAAAGIGSDTGGSCRIPAALCGIVGYKPTAATVPKTGAFPLSPTLDSIGPLANSADCCRILHRLMAGLPIAAPERATLAGLRLAVPQTVVLEGLEAAVARDCARAIGRLAEAGAHLIELPVPEFDEVAAMNGKCSFAATEAFAHHRALLASHAEGYDPLVRQRIARGDGVAAADYFELVEARAGFIARASARLSAFDAFVFPTVPILPPAIADLADANAFGRVNIALLRNSSLVNFLDGCAIALPIHDEGGAPTSLTIAALNGQDERLFAIAAAAEPVLRGQA